MAEEHDRSMMENLYWWGIPTLFRCPNLPAEGQDIALVGVPHSTGNGTTERDQHLGPRAVRNVSAVARRVHSAFEIDPWTAAKIADIGDVPFPRANDNEDCIERITAFYQNIAKAGARPVSIGGDHSITGGIGIAKRGFTAINVTIFIVLHLNLSALSSRFRPTRWGGSNGHPSQYIKPKRERSREHQ